jgi:DNA-binding NtrC family response regulator
MLHVQSCTNGIQVLLFTSCLGACKEVTALLERRGIRVTERLLEAGAGRHVESVRPDLILFAPGQHNPMHYQQRVREIELACRRAAIILLASALSEEMWITALRLGLKDFLSLPVKQEALFEVVDRWTSGRDSTPESTAENRPLQATMVGESKAMQRVKSYMTRAAASDCTVLITGETGTGKELAAEFIHDNSGRRNKAFVCVNCAAIPDSLLESELFGHARGAFTGADTSRDGLLVSAEGGTILLDEIGDMSLSAQAKILRVLEKKEVARLGSTQQRKIDIRFVAATNQDLEAMSDRGTFRKDLFYRLNAARVELPPLRDRREDIPLLVEFYRNRLGSGDIAGLSDDCMQRLSNYNWPGNVRELKNVLESLFLHCESNVVQCEELPGRLQQSVHDGTVLTADERERLVKALCTTQWNKSRAAEMMSWSRMTLYRKMAKYRIAKFPSPPV